MISAQWKRRWISKIILATHFSRFIEKYILCPVCKLPETTLKTGKESIKAKCRSCGKISKLDSTHKVATHILKNPPKDESEFKEEEKKKTTKEKPKKKEGETKTKKAKSAAEAKTAAGEETKKMDDITLSSSEVGEAIARIRSYKDAQKRSAQELVDEIANLCISHGFIKEDLKYYVAMHGLFDSNFLVQWTKEPNLRDAIKLMTKNDEVKGQCWVLLALEHFVLQSYATALQPHANTILKCFYDEGVLDEDTIIKCISGGKGKASEIIATGKSFNKDLHHQFHKEVEAFVKWLK